MLRSPTSTPSTLPRSSGCGVDARALQASRDAAILVAEVACGLPGCPPLETVVAFWSGSETRHQFKLFKPVTEVSADDLPPGLHEGALAAIDGDRLECC